MAAYSSIGRLITVTSCKGGVGKSTVSLELARRLAARGHSVGLFDADLHGPSLPAQLPQLDQKVELGADGYAVVPFECDGLRLMSFGWFSQLWCPPSQQIRVSAKLATSLLHTTAWGDLDYLVVDSPPGTGEIPVALATRVPLHGAVVVTTPSALATADVVRGVRMLERFKVPVLAVVENMASFECAGCGELHHPFGRGHLDEVLASIRPRAGHAAAPAFSLPIVADGVTGAGRLAGSLDALAESLEAGAPPAPTALPWEDLGFHERPHWPTEMAVAEYIQMY